MEDWSTREHFEAVGVQLYVQWNVKSHFADSSYAKYLPQSYPTNEYQVSELFVTKSAEGNVC